MDSSVSLVIRLLNEWPKYQGSILSKGGDFYLLHGVQTGSEALLVFQPVVIEYYCWEGKATGARSWPLTSI
jgi:hypothetical protein